MESHVHAAIVILIMLALEIYMSIRNNRP